MDIPNRSFIEAEESTSNHDQYTHQHHHQHQHGRQNVIGDQSLHVQRLHRPTFGEAVTVHILDKSESLENPKSDSFMPQILKTNIAEESEEDNDEPYTPPPPMQARRASILDSFRFGKAQRQQPRQRYPPSMKGAGQTRNFKDSHNSSFSASNGSFGASRYPNARELCETFGYKMKEISIIILVLIMNALLIYFGYTMESGFRVSISPSVVQYTGGVFVSPSLSTSVNLC
jgi:hypothetical protein